MKTKHTFTIRMTAEQAVSVAAAARASGLSINEWCRQRLKDVVRRESKHFQLEEYVLFDGEIWTVTAIEAVTEPYDGDNNYTQRLALRRDGSHATGVRNTEVCRL